MSDVKEILKTGMRFGSVRLVHPKRIDDAANQLLHLGTATRETLEEIGKAISGDSLLFSGVDVGQMNKALKKTTRVVNEEAVLVP